MCNWATTVAPALLLAGFAVSAPSLTAQGPDTLVSVSGVVGDAASGRPIAGATVGIAAIRKHTFTDEDGHFRISGIPSGTHEWSFTALGYSAWNEVMVVADGEFLRIGLAPQPVVLKNIEVTVDRLEQLRKASGTSVHAVTGAALRSIVAATAAEAVRSRVPYPVTGCPAPAVVPGAGASLELCVRARGRVVRPRIYLDDEIAPLSIEALHAFSPAEIHTIEYYGGGTLIRVYTNHFVASGRAITRP